MVNVPELVQQRIVRAASLQDPAEPPRADLVRHWCSALLLLLAAGCGDPSGPRTGAVQVTVTITGAELAPNGSRIAVDDGAGQAILTSGTVTFAGLSAGSHTVRLSGIVTNCSVSGANPRPVAVVGGATAQVAFAATCVPAAGILAVRVVRNVEFDPNGYSLGVDGAAPKFVPAVFPGYEQAVMVSGLSAGAHVLSISGVAAHCAASPLSPIGFKISAGTTTEIKVAIVCSKHEATSSG